MPGAFASWMAISSAIAVVAGLVLGVLAALEMGYGLERWTQAVQAHGRLQLWGFAGVFIVALSFEFMVRMNGRPPFGLAIRIGVPAALASGAAAQAAGQLWFEQVAFLGPAGGVMVLLAALWYAVVVTNVRPPHSLKLDPQPWFFWTAAAWLAVASGLSLAASMRWESGVALPIESHAAAEVFLRGFVLSMILAIAPRALAGHLGLPRLSASEQVTLLVVINLSTLAWLSGQEAWGLPGVEMLVRTADVSLAVALLAVTFWLRIFSGLARRYRGERYEWAIPMAWFGAVVYACGLAAMALAPAGRDASLYQEGAIRHIFMLGFMLPLMAAMAHIVLARFGTGSVPHENLLTAGFVLLLVAWPLRVLPALASDPPGDFARGLMAAAGLLTMAALTLIAVSAARTAALTNQPLRQVLRIAADA